MDIRFDEFFRLKDGDRTVFAVCFVESDWVVGINNDLEGRGVKFRKDAIEQVYNTGFDEWLTAEEVVEKYGE